MGKYKHEMLTSVFFVLLGMAMYNDFLKDYDKSANIYLFIIALVAINIRSLIIEQGKK